MASRPRSRAKRDWPRGLRESKPGYFVWDSPTDSPLRGASKAIGRVPLADAKMQAIEANLWAEQQGKERLVDRLAGADTTLADWLTTWTGRLETKGETAANTLKSYRSLARAVAGEIGSIPLARLAVKDIATALETIEEERGRRSAQAARSMLKTALTAAVAKGHMPTNPALSTESIAVTVQRQRFTWETFSKVWATRDTWPVWLANAVALALVTGQRREDIADARFTDFDEEAWKLTQGKTGRRLAIPLDLKLDALGQSLRDVLTACRRTGVVSRHLIHQTQPYGNSPVGAPLFVDRITKRFSDAVEGALGPGQNLPTFHELRSMCKRLYKEQGGVDTKTLLGHTTDAMAGLYEDARGAEFERVKVG
jgi:integrase